ncbi:MAG: PDZ domain-containing protein, partial [Acidimicrobiia bacterium]
VGVRVTNVTPDSAYDLGGGQINDVITALDEVAISSMDTLLTELRTRRAGETVSMAVTRADADTELTVTLDGRP